MEAVFTVASFSRKSIVIIKLLLTKNNERELKKIKGA